MKINEKIFSLPPYISTTWKEVKALHMENQSLVVTLTEGKTVPIPNLPQNIVDHIYHSYTHFLEQRTRVSPQNHLQRLLGSTQQFEGMISIGLGSVEGMPQVMHHNPEQAQSPDLPLEILEKIAAITKILSGPDSEVMSKPEPHCNCPHCQIARAMQPNKQPMFPDEQEASLQESVTLADLAFEDWEITQIDDKLYKVQSKLDQNESYQVFLGSPVGCTCGKRGCDHILTVLKS